MSYDRMRQHLMTDQTVHHESDWVICSTSAVVRAVLRGLGNVLAVYIRAVQVFVVATSKSFTHQDALSRPCHYTHLFLHIVALRWPSGISLGERLLGARS
ncbi:hypothetical protein K461DRAFT_136710 [Myriangium duriaei CBS 260.36]|uniref:Uncharacterized protein n=1 Tax=Myriangium duriaei CBS 260.36 TaxID=1168546 RepID=A0A9P4MHI1_9PEZI|nr:hypothetical protein K461DRAFT_136710 [Myriangium duriaei CBS 260.36]